MNNIWVLGSVFILCVIAAVYTFKAIKEMENKQKEYKNNPDSLKDAIQRSSEYEKSSWGTSIPGLTWMYIIATVVSLIALLIYMF
ncbi:hypothetical protein [Oceanobacillus sp. CAU 1775]